MGHGGISTIEDMKKYLDMLRGARATVAKAVKRGETIEQMKKQNILEHWKSYSSPILTTDGFIEALYNDLTNKQIGTAIKNN